jgi:hypothetical protein
VSYYSKPFSADVGSIQIFCRIRLAENLLNLLPDNESVDDFLKSLDIPAQETCSNVSISKSMCQFPVPMITNCQNITIDYNIFPQIHVHEV